MTIRNQIVGGRAQQGLSEELLELGMADTLGVSADQKSRLLMATEKQNQTTDRLRDSHSTILHAEGIGVSILHDLEQQRESLLHAHDTVPNYLLHTVDDNIGKSRRIIIAMVRRMDRDKWIMCGIITLLVLVILVILYFKFVR
ncbi:hypothetical protein PR202_ga10756 [Eleusine coracana subsp. coracana]|uniref:Uncharacterized protein n=1 Tax=Eleusine coracana subsp. coracana TaxID=191504 RepID=A0AAV5C7G0_ELECO|nr:hypothetical protein PR202_ga10756 [Eleusine coracana subsp. coracana]